MALLAALNILLGMNTAQVEAGAKRSNNALKGVHHHAKEAAMSLHNIEHAMDAVGIGVGIHEVVDLLKESALAAREELAEDRKLESVLKSTGHAAGFSADELKSYAVELQKTTNYAHGATTGAEAVLATFTQIKGIQFTSAIASIQDVSAVLGQDLQSSAIQVGKALNDPLRGLTALRRVGVSFSEDQERVIRSLVKTGDVAGAQNVILKELSTEFGGAAAAMRDDLTGLGNDFHDLLATIGELGETSGVFKTLATEVSSLSKTLKKHNEGHGRGVGYVLTDWFHNALDALHDDAMEAERKKATALFLSRNPAAEHPAGPGGAHAGDMSKLREVQDNYDALDKLTEKLKEEAQLYGLTGQARDIAALKLKGLTEEDLAEARAIDAKLQKLAAEATASKAAAAAAEKLRDDVAAHTKKLEIQITTFGMAAGAVELYEFKLRGASDAELAAAKAAQDQLDSLAKKKEGLEQQADQQKVAFEKFRDNWQALYEETRTPAEKYAAELKRLEDLHNRFQAEVERRVAAGQMQEPEATARLRDSDDVFERAKKQAHERFGHESSEHQPGHQAALIAGSSEAYSAIVRVLNPRDAVEKKSLEELKAIRKELFEHGKAERRKESPATLRRI